MKNVLITGATKGIGFETAKQLAQLGYFIFLGCRDIKKGTDAVNSLNEFGLTNVEAYFGAIQTTQQFLNLLMKSSEPAVINVSSESGSVFMQTSPERNPNWNFYNVYGSSKMAVNSFTIMLANELRNTNFRVNSVTPGYTATDLNDFKGTKSVQEGVKPIVKLVTSNSEYVTGEFLKEGGTVPW